MSTGIVDFLARVVVAVTNARILRQELSGAKNYPGGSNQPRRIPSPPSSAWDRMKSQTSFAWAGSASCCDPHMVGRDMLVGVFVRRILMRIAGGNNTRIAPFILGLGVLWLFLLRLTASHEPRRFACESSPTQDLLPNVIAPMTGASPVWLVDGSADLAG